MSESKKQLFCFGYGFCCDYLARLVVPQGWGVAGTTRDVEKKEQLAAQNIKSHIFDQNIPLNDPHFFLKDVTHILISSPPDDTGDAAFLHHAEDILKMPNLEWIGYLSSTSVYGDRGGELVDEASEVRPTSKRGTRRALAEAQWLSLAGELGAPIHIFRLAGIYGPGRSALESVRAGVARRIVKPGHAFSRIHVEDIAQTLLASINKPNPGSVYNVSDDMAAPSHEVISYACELLGIEPPPLLPFDEADMAPIALSFYNDNKRVDNHKIKSELGVKLRYPNYKLGLQACLEEEKKPSRI